MVHDIALLLDGLRAKQRCFDDENWARDCWLLLQEAAVLSGMALAIDYENAEVAPRLHRLGLLYTGIFRCCRVVLKKGDF